MGDESRNDDWDKWRARRRERVRQAVEGSSDESLFARRQLFVSRDGYEIKRNAAGELFFVHATKAGRNRTLHIDGRGEELLRDHGVGEGDRLSNDGYMSLYVKGFLYTEKDGYLKPDFMQTLPEYDLPNADKHRESGPLSSHPADDRLGTTALERQFAIDEQLARIQRQNQRIAEETTAAIARLQEAWAARDAESRQASEPPTKLNFNLEITDDSARMIVDADDDDALSYPFVVDAPTESDPLYTIYSENYVDEDGMIRSFLEARTFADAIRELFGLAAEILIESLELEPDE